MATKIIYKHRRGLKADWEKWLDIEGNLLLDGEIGILDADPNDSPNHLRLLVGDGQEHTLESMPKFAYVQEENGAALVRGYDYAEFFRWADDVPAEHRTAGRFVTIAENTRTIRPAQPDDKVLGITSNTASIIGNWDEDNRSAEDGWAVVGMLGIIEVRHDHTCTDNGYAMIGADGIATKTNDAFGYKVVNVNDEAGTIEVVLGNNSDMISRIKTEIDVLNKSFEEVESIAKGRSAGYVFDTVEELDVWLADTSNTSRLQLGDNLYIRAVNVPDYWWDGSAKQELETQKVDLTEIDNAIAQKTQVQIITWESDD